MAKKEKPRDHPFTKYIRKEVLRKARVDAERDKLKTKTYKVKVKAVKPETKKVMVNVKRVKPKTKTYKVKIEKVTKWGNKKFVKRSKTR